MVALLIGHRGAAGTAPENTLASFMRARELGAQAIEFDVHRTKDGHLVVIHDPSLERTTDGHGLVRDCTLEELKRLDAGSWKGREFTGERIPTLVELIETYPDLLFLELKAGSVHYPGIEADLIRVLRETGAHTRTQVSSFDHKALVRLRELDSELPTGMLHSSNLLDPVAMAQRAGCTALHPVWYWVTPAYVAEARAAGLQVNVWTVNGPAEIAYTTAMNVDGIMSDYPERLAGR